MIRYFFKTDTEIVLTNDVDINIIQNRNPATQEYFMNKSEALEWATEYVKEFNETLIESAANLEYKSEIDIIEEELSSQQTLINSISDTIVEMSMGII